jgi:hypothetical protein
VLLFVFALFRPGRTRTINDLQLTGAEKKQLEEPGFRIPYEA